MKHCAVCTQGFVSESKEIDPLCDGCGLYQVSLCDVCSISNAKPNNKCYVCYKRPITWNKCGAKCKECNTPCPVRSSSSGRLYHACASPDHSCFVMFCERVCFGEPDAPLFTKPRVSMFGTDIWIESTFDECELKSPTPDNPRVEVQTRTVDESDASAAIHSAIVDDKHDKRIAQRIKRRRAHKRAARQITDRSQAMVDCKYPMLANKFPTPVVFPKFGDIDLVPKTKQSTLSF